MRMSEPLDFNGAKEAVWPDHQHHDQNSKGDQKLVFAAEISTRERFNDADKKPGNQRSCDRVETPDDHYDEHRTRELALYTSWLAEAHLQLGAIDAAAHAATQALTLTARTTSARSDDRIAVLRRRLGPYRTVPAVAAFEDMAHELCGTIGAG